MGDVTGGNAAAVEHPTTATRHANVSIGQLTNCLAAIDVRGVEHNEEKMGARQGYPRPCGVPRSYVEESVG